MSLNRGDAIPGKYSLATDGAIGAEPLPETFNQDGARVLTATMHDDSGE